MLNASRLAVLLSALICRSVCADQIDLYVITGQSNSLGTTADPNESDRTPGSQSADAGTFFFWDNVSASNNAYPIGQAYGDSGGLITTLQPQQGDGGANPLFWGPEFGFARTMAEHGKTNIMVVKASRGGGGNTLWSKNAFQANPASGHMYQHVVDAVQSAANALTDAGHTFTIQGLLYLQGESDSADEANIAGQRFDELLTNLRADLPMADGMRAMIGGIGAGGNNRDMVRAKQASLALTDPTIDYFTNLDLVESLYDGLHFDKAAKLEIGRRYAVEFLRAAGQLPLIDVTAPEKVIDDADATHIVFDDYVPDVNGVAAGINLTHSGTFAGFVEGRNGQPEVGVLVDASDGQIVFADHVGGAPASDISVGAFNPPPRSMSHPDGRQGDFVRFTFVDPTNTAHKATVAGVAFNLGFASPADQILITFLDADGGVLHQEGVMPTGSFGFQSLDRIGGNLASNIHQVVVSGVSGASFTVGTPGNEEAVDFAFQGFRVIPEPTASAMYVAGVITLLSQRQRSF